MALVNLVFLIHSLGDLHQVQERWIHFHHEESNCNYTRNHGNSRPQKENIAFWLLFANEDFKKSLLLRGLNCLHSPASVCIPVWKQNNWQVRTEQLSICWIVYCSMTEIRQETLWIVNTTGWFNPPSWNHTTHAFVLIQSMAQQGTQHYRLEFLDPIFGK